MVKHKAISPIVATIHLNQTGNEWKKNMVSGPVESGGSFGIKL
jgi:hypothetical protein